MRLTEVDFGTAVPIDAYGPGFFRVKGEVIEGNLLMLPGSFGSWDGLGAWREVVSAQEDFDVLFIGMGKDIANLEEIHRQDLSGAGVAYEIMSTPAACRTYNVLLSEGRRVAAALVAT